MACQLGLVSNYDSPTLPVSGSETNRVGCKGPGRVAVAQYPDQRPLVSRGSPRSRALERCLVERTHAGCEMEESAQWRQRQSLSVFCVFPGSSGSWRCSSCTSGCHSPMPPPNAPVLHGLRWHIE
jgi:hypothetical protein